MPIAFKSKKSEILNDFARPWKQRHYTLSSKPQLFMFHNSISETLNSSDTLAFNMKPFFHPIQHKVHQNNSQNSNFPTNHQSIIPLVDIRVRTEKGKRKNQVNLEPAEITPQNTTVKPHIRCVVGIEFFGNRARPSRKNASSTREGTSCEHESSIAISISPEEGKLKFGDVWRAGKQEKRIQMQKREKENQREIEGKLEREEEMEVRKN